MALASQLALSSPSSHVTTMYGTPFHSCLNLVKCNYKIHNTEMLAILQGLEEWLQYLEGV
jgi:hypothetical protein